MVHVREVVAALELDVEVGASEQVDGGILQGAAGQRELEQRGLVALGGGALRREAGGDAAEAAGTRRGGGLHFPLAGCGLVADCCL